ncbi:L-amino acid N-acyltransferase YncA [Acinetobacter calcoaceticus]|uniref:L-amino acid N-acyltransferase YncA n=1 Tax=Acinetobacter calcoaceticus TaxID=471 RepID=A0A4R1XWQ5_ACICA|nr:L-amino acid N-acyltransferase YncA [Acinetobacter calcoaceticus]
MIRLAQYADAAGIAQVHVNSWLETYNAMVKPSVLAQQSVADRTELWKQVLLLAQHRVWVYQVQGEIVGFLDLDLMPNENHAEVRAVYLLAQHQGQGIGKQLMQLALSCCQQQHYHHLRLEVFDQNPSAKFYEKMGAVKVAEEDASDYADELKIYHYQWDLEL